MKLLVISLAPILLWAGVANEAGAWGSRGHNLISRVAVRVAAERNPTKLEFTKPLIEKEQMLGHLANVPDIVWKNSAAGDHTNLVNRPTHWVDVDLLVEGKPTFAKIPKSIADAKQAAAKAHVDLFTRVGSAPWRIKQLYTLYVQTLSLIRPDRPGQPIRKELLEAPVNQALLYGGLMSHFVGDLTQPHHSSNDYDSYDVGQGGLHAYFEEDVVDALPLDLDYEVFQYAVKHHPAEQLWASLDAKDAAAIQKDPLLLAWALAINDHAAIAEMVQIDKKYAVIKASKIEPTRLPAERHPPAKVMQHFRPLLVQRLALAADVLAFLWQRGWEDAGKPDLHAYFSYNYALVPDFIEPDYLQ